MSRRDDRTRQVPTWAPAVLLVLAVLTLVVGLVAGRLNADTQAQRAALELQTQRLDAILAAVTDQRDAAAGTALDLAAIIRGACDTGTIPGQYAAACLRAAEVQAAPAPTVVVGERGATGRTGAEGRPGAPGLTPPCYFEPTMCRGATGAAGPTGPAGPKGDTGDTGATGAPGAPGCDAGTSRDPDTQQCTPAPTPAPGPGG